MIKITRTNLKGVLQIYPYVFKDHRGEFIETYNVDLYKKKRIKIRFVQDDISISKRGVLRGIHSDNKAWKLISCIYGKMYVVVVNCNEKSRLFGKWQSFNLSGDSNVQILIPPRYGCSFLVLSKEAIFTYKQSEYYDPKRQCTYKWNDLRFKIKWPLRYVVLSKRDKIGHYI